MIRSIQRDERLLWKYLSESFAFFQLRAQRKFIGSFNSVAKRLIINEVWRILGRHWTRNSVGTRGEKIRDNGCETPLFSSHFLSSPILAIFLHQREREFCQASCWKFNHPRKRSMIVPRHVTRELVLYSQLSKKGGGGKREQERTREKVGVLNKTYGVSNKFTKKRRD